jgi:ABC-2 type transport system permease protein
LYFILFGCYAFMFFGVHFYLFSIPLNGNLLTLAVATSLFLLAAILAGIFISSFFKRKIIALQFFVFTTYPIFLASGYSWPLGSMPACLRYAASLLPTTPYFQVLVRITQMNAGWSDVGTELWQLVGLTVTGFLLAYYRFWTIKGKELKGQNP